MRREDLNRDLTQKRSALFGIIRYLAPSAYFALQKHLLGNAPSPFDLHFSMQATHPFGTLFTR